jgi:phospholipase/carboxylesterase
VGFSGALVGASRLARELRCRPPVRLIHGEADEMVPFGAMSLARHALAESGLDVRCHACKGLGHGIDMAGMFVARDFLFHRLEADPA